MQEKWQGKEARKGSKGRKQGYAERKKGVTVCKEKRKGQVARKEGNEIIQVLKVKIQKSTLAKTTSTKYLLRSNTTVYQFRISQLLTLQRPNIPLPPY